MKTKRQVIVYKTIDGNEIQELKVGVLGFLQEHKGRRKVICCGSDLSSKFWFCQRTGRSFYPTKTE